MPRRSLLVLAVLLAAGATVSFAQDAGMPMPMGRYWFGILRRGPTWTPGRSARTDSIQAGHMANIGRMTEDGALLSAGPFLHGGDWRGVFIFRPDSIARVRALAANDPAIQSNRLVLDLYSWFAPTGIGAPYQRMKNQPGFKDSMRTLQLVMLKRGPKWTPMPAGDMLAAHEAHVAGIFAGLKSGEFATAGPFMEAGPDTNYAGVIVMHGDSAKARARINQDPAVKAGRLAVELYPWMNAYGTMPGDTLRK